ncbi:MAG: hypothetical protein CVT98_02535 [Bacteroidetes bacterium HGW-Bacteroidetes-15]|nr:MAG: hypothetical protein CVT98_02535 [Bacteroidetes bacterium HGW-Bacteroidetes-15]
MELDSIIYIIIAIVLAIVNAVAQKKKKVAKEQASANSFENLDDQFESIETEDTEYQPTLLKDLSTGDPMEILFGRGSFPKEMDIEEQAEEQVVEQVDELQVEGVSAYVDNYQSSNYEKRMQERAQEFLNFDPDQNTFDFDEDSIASSAIGNALTEDEEEEANFQSKSIFMQEFDVEKAILYSEIIKPKYFSIGVIN